MSVAVHFGVFSTYGGITKPDALTVGTVHAVGTDENPSQLKYVYNGDSFIEWGEAATEDPEAGRIANGPLHIVLELPSGWAHETAVALMPYLRDWLEGALRYQQLRLCDYSVVTNHQDWSQDSQIVGAFA